MLFTKDMLNMCGPSVVQVFSLHDLKEVVEEKSCPYSHTGAIMLCTMLLISNQSINQ